MTTYPEMIALYEQIKAGTGDTRKTFDGAQAQSVQAGVLVDKYIADQAVLAADLTAGLSATPDDAALLALQASNNHYGESLAAMKTEIDAKNA